MDVSSELQVKGWYFSKEGLEMCKEGLERVNLSVIIQKALDMDLRDIGGKFFPEDLRATKLDCISGSGVVQIQKIKNASAPKYEYGTGAPPILRLLLTDGNTFVNCLQWSAWKSITMDTPPGTKIYLKPGKIPMQNSFMLLSDHQFTVLGGCVAPMVEKWELQKRLASHVRAKDNLDSAGPPPWIPFGKPIVTTKGKTHNFRSLEQDSKEGKEDAVFNQQRLANIAEVSKVKDGKPKVFGGGKDIKQSNNKAESDSYSYNNSNDCSGYNRNHRHANDFEDTSSPRKQNPRQWTNQDVQRPQRSGENFNAEPQFSRDKRMDQRNRFNPNGYHNNNRNQGTSQQKSFGNGQGEDGDSSSFRRPNRSNFNDSSSRVASTSKYHNNDRKSNDIEDLARRTSQVKLHGYDNQSGNKPYIPSKPFLQPGVEVMAKYWEDNKFYRATIHAVGQEGKTCVVHFMEYGNYEEVLVDDVQQLNMNSDWNVGPISFRPSHWENMDRNQEFPTLSEYQNNSNRSHSHHGNQDRQRSNRQEFRPSAKLYQPPRQRQI